MAATLSLPALLDEAGASSIREVIGTLLARAERAHVAIRHVRLAAIDLSATELQRVHCRILLGRLDVDDLSFIAAAPAAHERIAALAAFLDSGRLGIRAAGLLRWKPDFSVFELPPPLPAIALVGAHYFSDPDVHGGPALTCVVRETEGVRRLLLRFEELWRQARDVQDVVRAELSSLRA